jgi:AcrR family transcriptional regulator
MPDARRGGAGMSKKPQDAVHQDPRVARTRAALVEACIELCGEKDFQSLTIAEIACKAGVNRTTFYLHFEDKTDLLERGLEAMFERMAVRFRTRPPKLTEKQWTRERLGMLFSLIRERRTFFMPLFSGATGSLPLTRGTRFLERFLLEMRIPGGASPSRRIERRALAARATVSVLGGLVSWWLEHPDSATVEEMADFYLRYALNGMVGVGVVGRSALELM